MTSKLQAPRTKLCLKNHTSIFIIYQSQYIVLVSPKACHLGVGGEEATMGGGGGEGWDEGYKGINRQLQYMVLRALVG